MHWEEYRKHYIKYGFEEIGIKSFTTASCEVFSDLSEMHNSTTLNKQSCTVNVILHLLQNFLHEQVNLP